MSSGIVEARVITLGVLNLGKAMEIPTGAVFPLCQLQFQTTNIRLCLFFHKICKSDSLSFLPKRIFSLQFWSRLPKGKHPKSNIDCRRLETLGQFLVETQAPILILRWNKGVIWCHRGTHSTCHSRTTYIRESFNHNLYK